MTEESEDNKLEAPLDEAALNEEASRELEAMVAAEEPAAETEASEGSETYVVQNAAERRGVIEALIFVSEEPLSAKVISDVLREDRAVVEEALAELAKEFNGRNSGLQLREVAGWLAVCHPPEFQHVAPI